MMNEFLSFVSESQLFLFKNDSIINKTKFKSWNVSEVTFLLKIAQLVSENFSILDIYVRGKLLAEIFTFSGLLN